MIVQVLALQLLVLTVNVQATDSDIPDQEDGKCGI